jgi:hypothetical protein
MNRGALRCTNADCVSRITRRHPRSENPGLGHPAHLKFEMWTTQLEWLHMVRPPLVSLYETILFCIGHVSDCFIGVLEIICKSFPQFENIVGGEGVECLSGNGILRLLLAF